MKTQIAVRATAIITIIAALTINLGVIHNVEDNNMEPLIEKGQQILGINTDKYYLGQIVLVGESLYRVYGIEGDAAEVNEEGLHINGDLVKYSEGSQKRTIEINKDEYLVVGDNINSEIKVVNIEEIKGKVEVIRWK